MNTLLRRCAGSLAGALLLLTSAQAAVQINEIRIDMPSTDNDEYVEIKGSPGESLDGLWYLVVGDHSNPSGSTGLVNKLTGVVEYAVDLSGESIPESGLFLMTSLTFTIAPADRISLSLPVIFENSDNVTHLLVRGYTGIEVTDQADQAGDKAVDIDADDDGVIDNTPWTQVVDAVGVVASATTGDFFYGAALGFVDVGPNGSFAPGHLYRDPGTNAWVMGDFDLDPALGGVDTPGLSNPGAPKNPTISSVSPNYGYTGEVVTIRGTNLDTVTSVKFGDLAATLGANTASTLEVTIPVGATDGALTVTNPEGSVTAPLPFDIIPEGRTVLLNESFEGTGLGQFTQFSAASAAEWSQKTFGGNHYAEANGYQSDTASDDWLLSPALDLADVDSPTFSFLNARNFTGPLLEVKVSADYAGTGSPAAATWTNLTANLSTSNFTWTHSGDLDLAAYAGQTIHLALRYTSDGPLSGQGATIQVDEFRVLGTVAPASIFAGYDLAYDTWRILPWAFLYDGLYPFVYNATGTWYYVIPTAGAAADSSWYFYDFTRAAWGWTGSAYYPFFVDYAGGSAGEWKPF